ncbi:hypothetical protein ACFRFL_36215 [Streptomyces sp. NPDC056708]|uniref:hypothetical protein n=1 Tax=unclassified Streptomyces TaxID=2593676 RepID=UPI0036BA2DDD
MARIHDPRGFERLRELGTSAQDVRSADVSTALCRSALILAAKGGTLTDITVGDVLELFGAQGAVLKRMTSGTEVFYRLLHQLGALGEDAPQNLREVRNLGQRTPEELIDRYGLRCRPVRDLLVDYLRERQPALDYNSLKSLSYHLGKRFWQDIEHHHPDADSLRLAPAVIGQWKAEDPHQGQDRHHPRWPPHEHHGREAQPPGHRHPGAGLLPRYRPVGTGRSRPLGPVGGTKPSEG